MQLIPEGIGPGTDRQHDGSDKPLSQQFTKLGQNTELLPGSSFTRLDLERDDSPVAELVNEIDLNPVTRAPVSQRGGPLQPRRLLSQLPDDAGLQQVTEVGESRRVDTGERLRGESEPSSG